MDVEKIIEDTVNRTVMKLQVSGLLRDNRKTAAQKTDDLLKRYPRLQLSDQPYTKRLCDKIEDALDVVRPDPYFDIILKLYFEDWTREDVADYFDTTETTISRNKKRLVDMIGDILFSDDTIFEIFM